MKANELRLGNWVNCDKLIGEVTQIQDREVLEVDEIGYTIEDCKPIPLTEEWLIKFGFYKSEEYWTIDGSSLWWWLLSETKNVGIELMDNELFGVMNRYKIEYVHQLQNLYFALTGKELTIKE